MPADPNSPYTTPGPSPAERPYQPVTYLLMLDRLDERSARWLVQPVGAGPDYMGPVLQLPRSEFEAMGRPGSIEVTPVPPESGPTPPRQQPSENEGAERG